MDFEDGSVKGRHVVAESLKAAGVEYVFGIVGYPVIELGMAIQNVGIKYIGMRNEQAASYAAAAYGYLTGKPGVCLVVPGPGVIHALAGLANAGSNGWPVLCIAGSSEIEQDGLGAFQESLPPQGGKQIQSSYAAPICKYVAKATDVHRIPFLIDQALRYATHGRPGPVYLEIAGDTLREKINDKKLDMSDLKAAVIQNPVRLTLAPEESIKEAIKMLRGAKRPLIIVGKGAAICDASEEVKKFVNMTGIPFLPTPMGKGVIEDTHVLCSSGARSFVLKNADVILLIGARLNFILHYGLPPRYSKDVKFIHVEVHAEEIDAGRKSALGLLGHAKAIVSQLNSELSKSKFQLDSGNEWINAVEVEKKKSTVIFDELVNDRSAPMNYYCALSIVNKYLPGDCVIVNEGSDTMDIGRTVLLNSLPKHRLDAGTWGTMGVGLPQTIAGSLVNLSQKGPGAVYVAGDSAFGFSAMEFEVVTRYQLPVVVVIINNNGIGPFNPDDFMGLQTHQERLAYPGKALAPKTRYEIIATAFGAKGVFVETADELEKAMKEAMSFRPFKPTIINCMISPTTSRGKPAAPPYAKVGKL